MSPQRSSWKKKPDDIPLAQRSSPKRRLIARDLWVSFFCIATASFLVVFLVGPLFNLWQPYSSDSELKRLNELPPETLLGHFPYPEASPEDLVEVYPGLLLHRDAYQALREMRSAATADGVDLVLLSGYRSIELQEEIFYGTKSDRGQIAIVRAKVSAPPGYSEHSTGYAIDLGDANRRETDFEVEFESTAAFQWLEKNAPRYHFVLSFPKQNPQKVSYEPWHWRFEGTVDALKEFSTVNEVIRNLEIDTAEN